MQILKKIADNNYHKLITQLVGMIVAGTLLYAGIIFGQQTNTKTIESHKEDTKVQHMTVEAREDVAVTEIMVAQNALDVQKLKTAHDKDLANREKIHDKDMERILNAMVSGFEGVKTYIDAMHRND